MSEFRRRLINNNTLSNIHSNLVFWLPLNKEGATKDIISGTDVILGPAIQNNTGNFSYSPEQGMYCVNFQGELRLGEYLVKWPTEIFTSKYFETNDITVYCECLLLEYSGKTHTCFIINNLKDVNSVTSISPLYNATALLKNWPINKTLYLAHVFNDDNRKYYQQEKLYNTYSVHTPYLPSTWADKTDNNLYIGPVIIPPTASIHYYYPYKLYIRNFRIYNKCLTLDEINNIKNEIY
jgi:ribosomal silencing factor RsfS